MPELVLITAAVFIYIAGAFFASRRPWAPIAFAAIAIAAAALFFQNPSTSLFASFASIKTDSLALAGRWFALAAAALLVAMSAKPLHVGGTSEYVGSLLLTVAGLMFTVSAGDLVLLFVSLELISIPTYILLYLGRHDAQGQEAAVKYFFLSVLSSAVLLYGFSFLYGVSHSTNLAGVISPPPLGEGPGVRAVELPNHSYTTAEFAFSKIALALIFAGLCFKIAAVPFHFYAADVYQGTNYPNAALLSVIPKAAGLAAMIRIILVAMPGLEPYSWMMVLVISALTMTVGNVLALWQDNLRRLMAYSSVANAGYILIGLAVALVSGNSSDAWNGLTALGFYLAVYAAATIGTLALLEHLGRSDRRIDGVEELAGLAQTRPLAAAILAVFMFSLSGVPPLAGFWAKFLIFGSALNVTGNAQPWFIALAVVGLLNAAVAAAYYLRIVSVMYFRTPLATPRAEGGLCAWLAALICAILVIALGLYPAPLIHVAQLHFP